MKEARPKKGHTTSFHLYMTLENEMKLIHGNKNHTIFKNKEKKITDYLRVGMLRSNVINQLRTNLGNCMQQPLTCQLRGTWHSCKYHDDRRLLHRPVHSELSVDSLDFTSPLRLHMNIKKIPHLNENTPIHKKISLHLMALILNINSK